MASADVSVTAAGHFKDAILAKLAAHQNVAQFASFAAHTCEVRHLYLADPPSPPPATVSTCVDALICRSADGAVNVRAFDPYQPKSHEFLYGLTRREEVVSNVTRLAECGLFTIVNETIDVADGGVSGVQYGGIVEFAPDDTPRCVEKPGVASLPRPLAMRVLQTVYGFEPDLAFPEHLRVEFSIHPRRCGIRQGHTLMWEEEALPSVQLEASLEWPNLFSRLLGDKVFGLLIADGIGLKVPKTTVVARRVASFDFGQDTGETEVWLRTAPLESMPGLFTTSRRWIDPFRLLANEDPQGDRVSSVLVQHDVPARYSGAAGAGPGGAEVVEGVRGYGDKFMLGEAAPEPLPAEVSRLVRDILRKARSVIGDVRVEWVFDGTDVWVVQLHSGSLRSSGDLIYPGTPTREHEFQVSEGLESLRRLVAHIAGTGEGVILLGSVGVTSHFGDVLRKAQVPSRVMRHSAGFTQERLHG